MIIQFLSKNVIFLKLRLSSISLICGPIIVVLGDKLIRASDINLHEVAAISSSNKSQYQLQC